MPNVIYTVRPDGLLREADSIERTAKESLKSWIMLGQLDKYSNAMQEASLLRRAAAEKSVYTRREILRNAGYTVKTPKALSKNPKTRNIQGVTMATKKFSPAQIAAQKLFAERARAGTLNKGKRKANPVKGEKTFKTGDYVKTDRGEIGRVSFYKDQPKGYANVYRLIDVEANDPYASTFLENGNFINGTRLKAYKPRMAKRNPDKSKPRAYVKRASQATGAPPSKRLLTRRKMALKAPAGYFPNPKAAMMTGYQVIGMLPKKHVVGIFKTMARAKNIATFMADANGVPYGVKAVKVHKTHFAV